jgi:hypothetical protein
MAGFRHWQGPAFVAPDLDRKKRLSLCVFVGRTVVGAKIDRHGKAVPREADRLHRRFHAASCCAAEGRR